MSEQMHRRAMELIAKQRVESICSDDQLWLAQHLAGCPFCATENQRIYDALSALRTMNIDVPHNLASRTQFRVRLRAEELRERSSGTVLLWSIAAISWALGIATAPLVWRGFAWAGQELHLPKVVWITGVALWWAVPALVAIGIILFGHKSQAGASE
jgi:hypothetical protein